MAEQLFNHFADIPVLEQEKQKIIGIFGEVKQGIIELSQLGFKIDASKSVKEIAGYQKQIEGLQTKLIESQRKIDDAVERSRILQERAAKEEANRKLAELKLREANEKAIDRETAAMQRKSKASQGGLKDRPVDSIPFEIKSGGTENLRETGDAINEINKAEAEGAIAANEWADAQKRAGAEVSGAINKESVSNITTYRDELERMTGTLSENRAIQNIYKKELGEVQQKIKILESTTSDATKNTDAYQRKLSDLTATEAKLKKEITDINGTLKQQTILENSAAGSLDAMNARLILLNKEYAKLSATAKASPIGSGLKTEITQLNSAILAEEAALGRSQKNVGNYSNSIVKAANGAFGAIRKIAYILPGIGIAGIFSIIGEGIIAVIDKLELFSNKAQKLQKEVREAFKGASDEIGKQVGEVKALYAITQDITIPIEQRRIATEQLVKANDENNKKTGEHTRLLVDQNGILKKNDEAINALSESLVRQAKTKAFLGVIEKAYAKIIEEQTKSLDDQTNGIEDFIFGIQDKFRKLTGAPLVSKNQIQIFSKAKGESEAIDYFEALKKIFNSKVLSGELGLEGLFGGGEKDKQQLQKYQIDLKSLFELRKRYLEEQIELEKNLSSLGPLAGRIQARRRQAELEQQLAKETLAFELDGINQKRDKELESAKNSIKTSKELNNAINIINQNAANERAVLEDDANKKILESNRELQNGILVIKQNSAKEGQEEAQRELERLEALENEKFEIRLKADERNRQLQKDKIEIGRDVELEKLERTFQKQFKAARGNEDKEKKAIKDYEKAKEAIIDRANLAALKNDLYFYEHRLRIIKAFSTGSVAEIKAIEQAELALAATRRAIAEAESKGEKTKSQNQKDEGDPIRDALDKMVQINNVLENAIGGALNAAAVRRKNIIQEQIDDIERLKEAEINRINASADSEERKAARIKLVEASTAAEREKLERKKRQIDIQQARFEKAAAIMNIILNTAVAVSRAVTPFGKAIALASGAVQLGIAIATPIPQFFKGTLNSPAGPAEVGEQGRELAVEPGGRVRLFSQHSVQNLVKGTKIFPNQVTERILAAANVNGYQKLVHVLENQGEAYGEEIVHELKEIKKRTGFTVIINQGIDPGWWSKHMKN